MPRATVLVLGDVGRSPRMQYHAHSLANLPDMEVDLVGFAGERCVDDVENHPRIHRVFMQPWFVGWPRWLFLFWAPLKVIIQVIQLFWTLLISIGRPDTILVQNPPSIPTLMVGWIVARLRGARFVIDWHNFGYTVLALSLGGRNPLVKVSEWYESFFARRADAHLCVTEAMRRWLATNWGIHASVLYDRAPAFFRPTAMEERHELFERLRGDFPPDLFTQPAEPARQTLFTERTADGDVRPRPDRPALLLSSTSWTEDEDFGILLGALAILDARAQEQPDRLPRFVVAVTGKGPQKALYEARIRAMRLRHVAIRTLWLEPGDYPRLLGSADLGICLHTSTSGLDLPMKVVDMFGCELPVGAVNFECLHELVRPGENGFVFETSEELADRLETLFRAFPVATQQLERLRQGVRAHQSVRWDENWREAALPVLFPSLVQGGGGGGGGEEEGETRSRGLRRRRQPRG